MMGPALLASFANLDMHPINYKGEALALNDFMSGRLQLMFISGTLVPHVKDGKLRALATTLDSRSPLLPEVPTMVEAGLPPFPVNPWIALRRPGEDAEGHGRAPLARDQRGAQAAGDQDAARQPGLRGRRIDAQSKWRP